jgi:hypothetical protein
VTALKAIILVFITAALAAGAGAIGWLAFGPSEGIGAGAGAALGFGLTLAGGVSVQRAMNKPGRYAAMTHIYTGIAVRMLALFVGFFVLMGTGWASPVGFAVAFLAGVVAALARQVMVYGFEREALASGAN